MLKNISPVLSPEMLKLLSEMGHQDMLVLGDANFPAERYKKHGITVLRADGIKIPELLEAILELYPLDTYVEQPVNLMEVPADQKVETPIWGVYKSIVKKYDERGAKAVGTIERGRFYEICNEAYAVIQTGEEAVYANIILDKGIVG